MVCRHSGSEVTVIGAGVVGLTSALRICEELPGTKVTVIAERFDQDTTSAGAAGLWEPYKLSDTPPELIKQWGQETFQHLQVGCVIYNTCKSFMLTPCIRVPICACHLCRG